MHTLAIVSSDTKAANNSRYILTAYRNREIPDTRFITVSDSKDAAIFKVSEKLDIPRYFVHTNTDDQGEAMRDILLQYNVDLVLLLGYAKRIKGTMLEAFPNRILNYHPAPIPMFGGKGMVRSKAQAAVLKAEAEYTGPVIHLVDEEYDHGQILAHWPIKVRPEDTPESLNERCNLAGRRLYIQVINDFIYRLNHPDEFF